MANDKEFKTEYTVTMNTLAVVRARITVQADSPADARKKALQSAGDIEWKYDGLEPSADIDIEDIEEN